MHENVWQAYAKSRETPGKDRVFLPLIDHSCDVAAVLVALLELPTVAARLARLAGQDLDPTARQRLGVLAALHDVGKANVGFQNRVRGLKPDAGHIQPIVSLLDPQPHGGREQEKLSLRRAFIAASGLDSVTRFASGELFETVLAHHGSLPAPGQVDQRLWVVNQQYDPFAAIGELRDAIRGWFADAFGSDGRELPETPRFLHAFLGLLTLADWLGSDSNVFQFPADGAPSGAGRMAYARAAALRVLEQRFLDPTSWRPTARARPVLLSSLVPAIKELRWPQRAVVGLSPPPAEGRVVVLEAETGSGKTEAAVLHFLRLFRRGVVDGMYFALPTRAAATQIQKRVVAMLKNFLGDAAPPVGLAVLGYVQIDDVPGERLPDFHVLWPDDPKDTLRDRGWAVENSKRYLAGAVVVGTIDQLLLGGLRVRHAQLRSGLMLRLLLVIDEVHASDAYMEALLRRVLDQHRAAGGYALLLSATLGGAARQRLLAFGRAPTPVSLQDARGVPYPLLSTSDDQTRREPGEEPDHAQKNVSVKLVPAASCEELASRALAAAEEGARVLVIRNVVRDAQELQLALRQQADAAGRIELLFACHGVPAPHHARFAAEDRRLLDATLERYFGGGSTTGGVVAVATQTAEQSLDIDADLMITDLCPADVLLQRIGRLHRRAARVRPLGFSAPQLVVLAPSIEELGALLDQKGEVHGRLLGLGRVYPDLVGIAATRSFLADTHEPLSIPRMNRAFVEAATHPEALAELAKRLGQPWLKHRQHMAGVIQAAKMVAGLNAIDWQEPLAPGWPGKAVDEVIRTRLGLDTRRAELPAPAPGPFGEPVRTFLIPGWMAGDASGEATITDVARLAEGALTFRFGARDFRYDALGLRLAK